MCVCVCVCVCVCIEEVNYKYQNVYNDIFSNELLNYSIFHLHI